MKKKKTGNKNFIYIFEYVIQNKEFIKTYITSGSKEYFLKFAYKQTNLLIINFIEKEYKDKKLKKKIKSLLQIFINMDLLEL